VRSLPFFSLLITEQFNNSLEAFARICVNGFLFDPEVNIFGSSSLPLQSEPYCATPGALLSAGATGTGMTDMARQTSLNRGRSITQRFRRFQRSMLRPFALPTRAPPALAPHSSNSGGGRNGYPYEATPVDGGFATLDNGHLNANFNTNGITFTNFNGQTHNQTHHRDTSLYARQPSEPSYLSRVMRSDAHGTGNNSSHPKADTLSLPFRLSISHLHSKT
jgi:voltage-dependent calcium channel